MADRGAPAAWRTLGRAVLLAGGLAAAGWLVRDLPMHDLPQRARAIGLPGFVLLGAAACAVGLPRQAVAFAGGYAHGIWLGGGLAMVAQLAGCALDLAWARGVAGRLLQARLRGRHIARLNGLLAAHPFRTTLTLRLLPVGSNVLLNMAAGALRVPAGWFLLASLIGYLPQTVVFALLGGGVQVARGTDVALAALLLGLSIAVGLTLMRTAPVASLQGQDDVAVLPPSR